MNLCLWLFESSLKWLPVIIIFFGDLYILIALFVAASNSDAMEEKRSISTFLSDYYFPNRRIGLIIFILIFLIILFGFAAVFNGRVDHFLDKADRLYFSFTTLTTVGYGDFTPHTPVAKYLIMYEMASGVLLFAGGLGFLISRLSIF